MLNITSDALFNQDCESHNNLISGKSSIMSQLTAQVNAESSLGGGWGP